MRDFLIIAAGFALGQVVCFGWRWARPRVLAMVVAITMTVALGGCTRTVAVMQPRAAIPTEMLTCPPPPDLRRARTDADVAHGIVALAAAGRACRAHLDATARVLNSGH